MRARIVLVLSLFCVSLVSAFQQVPHFHKRPQFSLLQSDSSSSTTSSTVGTATKSLLEDLSNLRNALIASTYYNFPRYSRTVVAVFKQAVRSGWWMSPMILALVPLLSGGSASTPSFWKMVNVSHLRDAPHLLSVFLGSNISYFCTGVFMLLRFLATPRHRWLGVWTLMAGAISTIFHSVQALGDYAIAEGWCYLDHGVAMTAIAYFWHVCGPPCQLAWTLGISGLLALATPVHYELLHSTWHFLSAAAALVWALQGRVQRKAKLEAYFVVKNQQRQ